MPDAVPLKQLVSQQDVATGHGVRVRVPQQTALSLPDGSERPNVHEMATASKLFWV